MLEIILFLSLCSHILPMIKQEMGGPRPFWLENTRTERGEGWLTKQVMNEFLHSSIANTNALKV